MGWSTYCTFKETRVQSLQRHIWKLSKRKVLSQHLIFYQSIWISSTVCDILKPTYDPGYSQLHCLWMLLPAEEALVRFCNRKFLWGWKDGALLEENGEGPKHGTYWPSGRSSSATPAICCKVQGLEFMMLFLRIFNSQKWDLCVCHTEGLRGPVDDSHQPGLGISHLS